MIGVPDEVKGEALVCVRVLAGGRSPSEALRRELHERIVTELGKPFAPRAVKFVRALPKTRNAKVMRRVIRAAFLEEDRETRPHSRVQTPSRTFAQPCNRAAGL